MTVNQTELLDKARVILTKHFALTGWEKVAKDLLASKKWNFDKGSPTGAVATICEEETGKVFVAAATLGANGELISRAHLVAGEIDKLCELHQMPMVSLKHEVYLQQKNRLNKAVTTRMNALVEFELFAPDRKASYVLTKRGHEISARLTSEGRDPPHNVSGGFAASDPRHPTYHSK